MQIILGDCLEKLKELPDNSVDSIVTDPPYELGFMGKSWDNTGIANNKDMWAECLRVLKPGGHLLSFSGTRTYHRMACAIEDAGFEVRDMIEWVYGSGFPKSHNIGKNIEKIKVGGIKNLKQIGTKKGIKVETGTQGFSYSKEYVAGKSMGGKQISGDIPVYEINNEWEGWGTALKPAHEPICMARKPLAEKTVAENCLKYGTGGINIDESRVGYTSEKDKKEGQSSRPNSTSKGMEFYAEGEDNDFNRSDRSDITGRFPANLIHDNSEEVRECFPDAGKGNGKGAYNYAGREYDNKDTSMFNGDKPQAPSNFNDSGNASRFFKSIVYIPKASKSERNKGCEGLEDVKKEKILPNFKCNKCGFWQNKGAGGGVNFCQCEEPDFIDETIRTSKNNHPTVKPIALMEYLIKMVTPPIVFVCEKCYNTGYEKQKTNSDSTQLSNMRDTVQTERQSAQGNVLLQEVCLSGSENNNRETLSVLQENVSTQENGQTSPDLLQSELCGETYRDNEKVKSATKNKEGLFSNIQTRTSNVKQAGDGFTTPNNNGGTLGEESTSDRNSSSQESQERRQQNRELGNNDTQTAQPNSKTKEENNLSSLSGNRRCPKCGENMVKRAGVVLDPFAGSGSTGVACIQNGFDFIGIDMTPEYVEIAKARIGYAQKEANSRLF